LNPKICKTLGIVLIVAFAVNLASGLVGGPSVGVAVAFESSYEDLPDDQLPPNLTTPTGSRPSDWYLTGWWKLVNSYEWKDWLTDDERNRLDALKQKYPNSADYFETGGVWPLSELSVVITKPPGVDEVARLWSLAFGRFYSFLGTQYKPLAYSDKPPASNQLPYWTDVKFDANGNPLGFGASTDYSIKVHSSIAHNKFLWDDVPGYLGYAWYIEGGSYLAPDGKEWPLPIWAYPDRSAFVFPEDVHPLWGWIDNRIEPWWMGMKCDNREAIEWTFWCAMTFTARPVYSYLVSAPTGKGALPMIGWSLAFPKGVPMSYYQESWATAFGTAYNYLPEKVAASAQPIVGDRGYFCDKCPFAARDPAVLDQHRYDFHGIPFATPNPWQSIAQAQQMHQQGNYYIYTKNPTTSKWEPVPMPKHDLLNPLDTLAFRIPREYVLIPVPAAEGTWLINIDNWWLIALIVGILLFAYGMISNRRERRS